MTIAAKESGIKNIIVPLENVQEAGLVNGIEVYGFDDLKSTIDFIEGIRGKGNYTRINTESSGITDMMKRLQR